MKSIFNASFFKGLATGVLVLSLSMVALTSSGASVNLRAIKPVVKQTAPLSDEQQAIMAVRTAKASVVNIVGTSVPSSGTGLSAVSQVSGTGFIIDADGLIVSNSHVVSDTTFAYAVIFSDGSQFDAKVLGLDKFNDVAILKIDTHGLSVANLGNSDNLETGQTVFAIGNSLGKYQNTVTKGVVSGLGRIIDVSGSNAPQMRLQHLIQTDAAINHGNSGGPLINLTGEVVGMNTVIDEAGSSLGFAVPINVIKDSVSQLKNFGNVSKPYIGLEFFTLTKGQQLIHNLAVSQGAYITAVRDNTAAVSAGLKVGDIITAVNGELLTEKNEFDAVVTKYQAGTQITITYTRNGQSRDVLLVLGVLK